MVKKSHVQPVKTSCENSVKNKMKYSLYGEMIWAEQLGITLSLITLE